MGPKFFQPNIAGLILVFLLSCGVGAHGQVFDTSPPQLTGLSFTPPAVNVAAGPQNVTLTLTVTDNLAGVGLVAVQFRSPSGLQFAPVNMQYLPRITGTALNGTWEGTVPIPQFAEAGTWKLNVYLQDSPGNFVYLTPANLAALRFPTDLTVTSIPDTQAPQITAIRVSPPSISVSSGPQNVTIALDISDDISGVDFSPARFVEFRLHVTSPSGGQQQFMPRQRFTMTGGSLLAGTWEGAIPIPRYSEPGTWKVSQVRVIDFAGNQRFYNATQLASLGPAAEFTVVSSPADTTKPEITGVRFTPLAIDTSASSRLVTVTLNITDDLAGTSFASDVTELISFSHGVLFTSPSGGQSRYLSSFTLAAGTPQNGTWVGNVFFPQFSEGGTWKLSLLNIKDAAHNGVLNGNMTTAQMAAAGFPTDLVIFQPSTSVDGTVGTEGGTVNDVVFGNRASITFPRGSLRTNTNAAIDVLLVPPAIPTPTGYTTGTLFVNVTLTPTPPMPFPAPGLTLTLPFSTFRTPRSPIALWRLDSLTGLLVPATTISGPNVVGTVNSDGLSATFTGVSRLSTLVGLFPVAVLGDVDGSGTVDCADLRIVRAAFGKRTGQPGFVQAADLNRNGVVDVSDLALVSRQLPPSTVCQ